MKHVMKKNRANAHSRTGRALQHKRNVLQIFECNSCSQKAIATIRISLIG